MKAMLPNIGLQWPLLTRLNPRVMFVGDSITNNGFSSTFNGTNNHGYAHWVGIFSEGRIQTPNALNFGVGGDRTMDVLARIAAIKSATADVAVLLIGTNDTANASISIDVIKANYRKIVDALQRSGKVVCCVNVLPRSAGVTSDMTNKFLQLKDWIREEMPAMGCIVADATGEFLDKTRGPWGCKADLFIDDLHPNPAGAQLLGKVVWKALEPLFPVKHGNPRNPVEYSAATNPYGSVNPNPAMAGTGGSINANCNAVVGSTLATNWSISAAAWTGLTTSMSKVVEDGVEKQVFQVTDGTPLTGATLTLTQTLDLARIPNGASFKIVGNIEVEQGARTISSASIELRITDTATIYRRSGNQYNEGMGFHNDGFSGIMESDVYVATGTKTEVRARALITPTVGIPSNGVKVKLWNLQVIPVL